jgi:signal transduction histidine kinase
LNLAPCDVSELVDGLAGQWRQKASTQGVEVLTEDTPGLPEVRGDRMRLEQALSNLVANAIEAMPNGGRVRIAVAGPVRADVLGEREVECVEVVIEDHGMGIKKEDMDRIVDPFVTTKARGTGLGLPIAKRIIEEHKGELKIESEEGEGTRVTVRLPLTKGGGR